MSNKSKNKYQNAKRPMDSNKIVMTIVTLGLVVFLGIIFTGGPSEKKGGEAIQNIEVKDGIQYIRIGAKGGYTPANTVAQSGIPTKLIVSTSGTFDCSSALVIREINFQQILPQTGETEIDLGTPEVGETFEGLCSMGMYNFTLEFI